MISSEWPTAHPESSEFTSDLWYGWKPAPDGVTHLSDGKLECRYHVVGSHGGAWIYKVASNEELDRLLAMSPVYNFATYQVLALAEMTDPFTVAGKSK